MVSFINQFSYMHQIVRLFIALVFLLVSSSFVIRNEQLTNCDSLKIDAIIQHTSNGNNNGNVNVTISGGVEPYRITWVGQKRNKGIENSEIGNQSSLSKGEHLLVVMEAANCIKKIEIK